MSYIWINILRLTVNTLSHTVQEYIFKNINVQKQKLN